MPTKVNWDEYLNDTPPDAGGTAVAERPATPGKKPLVNWDDYVDAPTPRGESALAAPLPQAPVAPAPLPDVSKLPPEAQARARGIKPVGVVQPKSAIGSVLSELPGAFAEMASRGSEPDTERRRTTMRAGIEWLDSELPALKELNAAHKGWEDLPEPEQHKLVAEARAKYGLPPSKDALKLYKERGFLDANWAGAGDVFGGMTLADTAIELSNVQQLRSGKIGADQLQWLYGKKMEEFKENLPKSWLNTGGSAIAQSIPLGLELLVTGGSTTAGKLAVKEAGEQAVKEVSKSFMRKAGQYAAKKGTQLAIHEIASIPKYTAQAWQQSLAETGITLTDDEAGQVRALIVDSDRNMATDAARNLIGGAIDTATEIVGGEVILLGGKALSRKLVAQALQRLPEGTARRIVAGAVERAAKFANRDKSAFVKFVGEMQNRAGWSGLVPEWLEEDVSQFAQWATTQLGRDLGIEAMDLGVESPTEYGNPESMKTRVLALVGTAGVMSGGAHVAAIPSYAMDKAAKARSDVDARLAMVPYMLEVRKRDPTTADAIDAEPDVQNKAKMIDAFFTKTTQEGTPLPKRVTVTPDMIGGTPTPAPTITADTSKPINLFDGTPVEKPATETKPSPGGLTTIEPPIDNVGIPIAPPLYQQVTEALAPREGVGVQPPTPARTVPQLGTPQDLASALQGVLPRNTPVSQNATPPAPQVVGVQPELAAQKPVEAPQEALQGIRPPASAIAPEGAPKPSPVPAAQQIQGKEAKGEVADRSNRIAVLKREIEETQKRNEPIPDKTLDEYTELITRETQEKDAARKRIRLEHKAPSEMTPTDLKASAYLRFPSLEVTNQEAFDTARDNARWLTATMQGKGPKVGDVFEWGTDKRQATIQKVRSAQDPSNPYGPTFDFYDVTLSEHPLRLPGTKGGAAKVHHDMTLTELVLQGYKIPLEKTDLAAGVRERGPQVAEAQQVKGEPPAPSAKHTITPESEIGRIGREAAEIGRLQAIVKARSQRYQADRKDEVGRGIGVSGESLDLPFEQWSAIDRTYTAGNIEGAKKLAAQYIKSTPTLLERIKAKEQAKAEAPKKMTLRERQEGKKATEQAAIDEHMGRIVKDIVDEGNARYVPPQVGIFGKLVKTGPYLSRAGLEMVEPNKWSVKPKTGAEVKATPVERGLANRKVEPWKLTEAEYGEAYPFPEHEGDSFVGNDGHTYKVTQIADSWKKSKQPYHVKDIAANKTLYLNSYGIRKLMGQDYPTTQREHVFRAAVEGKSIPERVLAEAEKQTPGFAQDVAAAKEHGRLDIPNVAVNQGRDGLSELYRVEAEGFKNVRVGDGVPEPIADAIKYAQETTRDTPPEWFVLEREAQAYGVSREKAVKTFEKQHGEGVEAVKWNSDTKKWEPYEPEKHIRNTRGGGAVLPGPTVPSAELERLRSEAAKPADSTIDATKIDGDFFRAFAKAVPAFRVNPTFTVEGKGENMRLVFKDKYRFAVPPGMVGETADTLKAGQTVRIAAPDIVKPIKQADVGKGKPPTPNAPAEPPAEVAPPPKPELKAPVAPERKVPTIGGTQEAMFGVEPKRPEIPEVTMHNSAAQREYDRRRAAANKPGLSAEEWTKERDLLAEMGRTGELPGQQVEGPQYRPIPKDYERVARIREENLAKLEKQGLIKKPLADALKEGLDVLDKQGLQYELVLSPKPLPLDLTSPEEHRLAAASLGITERELDERIARGEPPVASARTDYYHDPTTGQVRVRITTWVYAPAEAIRHEVIHVLQAHGRFRDFDEARSTPEAIENHAAEIEGQWSRSGRAAVESPLKAPGQFRPVPSQTETPEFKKWYAGSVLVDKEGNPFPVYHGTTAPEDFSEFAAGQDVSTEGDEFHRVGSGADPRTFLGSHFAKEPQVANKFARGLYGERGGAKTGRVYKAWLSIKKPYRTSDSEMMDDMLSESYTSYSVDEALQDDEANGERYDSDVEYRKEVNADALQRESDVDEPTFDLAREMASKYRAKLEAAGYDGIEYKNEYEGGTSYVAFSPEQVKSATGNRGTFDPNNPDIRYRPSESLPYSIMGEKWADMSPQERVEMGQALGLAIRLRAEGVSAKQFAAGKIPDWAKSEIEGKGANYRAAVEDAVTSRPLPSEAVKALPPGERLKAEAALRKLHRQLTGSNDPKTLEIVPKVLDAHAQEQAGMYLDGVSTVSERFIDKPDTLRHEDAHYALDIFATDAERAIVYGDRPRGAAGETWDKLSEHDRREQVAEGVNRYAKWKDWYKEQPKSWSLKARLVITNVLRRIRNFIGKKKDGAITGVRDFYTKFLGGELPGRPAQEAQSGRAYQNVPGENAPQWYSKMRRVMDEKLPGRQPAKMLLNTIDAWQRKGEFKAEELADSGLKEWLQAQDGTVTKQQILDHLDENAIQIKEVVKGRTPEKNAEVLDADREWNHYQDTMREKYGPTFFGKMTDTEHAEYDRLAKRWEELDNAAGTETKFSQYDIPGAEPGSHRELLMTLPDVKAEPRTRGDLAVVLKRKYGDNYLDNFDRWTPDEVARYNQLPGNLRATGHGFEERPAAQFHSSHWDEPNPLAHIIFTTRTDADGKKVMFVESYQSDWHEKGRTEGYADKTPRAELERQLAEAKVAYGKLDFHGLKLSEVQATPEAQRVMALEKRLGGAALNVPDAPFKKSWPTLTFKRALRWAAENGYERLTWTTGAQQHGIWGSPEIAWVKEPAGTRLANKTEHEAKYGTTQDNAVFRVTDLENETDLVETYPTFDAAAKEADALNAEWRLGGPEVGPVWRVSATEQRGGNAQGIDLEGEARARGILKETQGQVVRSQEDLQRVIASVARGGEENAAKLSARIWAKMQTQDAGTSLPRKEFFELLYDKLWTQAADEAGAKFGVKAGETKIRTQTLEPGEKWEIVDGEGNVQASFATQAEAEQRMIDDGGEAQGFAVRQSENLGSIKGVPVHSLDLTPSLVQSVLAKGQPLYKPLPGATSGGEFKKKLWNPGAKANAAKDFAEYTKRITKEAASEGEARTYDAAREHFTKTLGERGETDIPPTVRGLIGKAFRSGLSEGKHKLFVPVVGKVVDARMREAKVTTKAGRMAVLNRDLDVLSGAKDALATDPQNGPATATKTLTRLYGLKGALSLRDASGRDLGKAVDAVTEQTRAELGAMLAEDMLRNYQTKDHRRVNLSTIPGEDGATPRGRFDALMQQFEMPADQLDKLTDQIDKIGLYEKLAEAGNVSPADQAQQAKNLDGIRLGVRKWLANLPSDKLATLRDDLAQIYADSDNAKYMLKSDRKELRADVNAKIQEEMEARKPSFETGDDRSKRGIAARIGAWNDNLRTTIIDLTGGNDTGVAHDVLRRRPVDSEGAAVLMGHNRRSKFLNVAHQLLVNGKALGKLTPWNPVGPLVSGVKTQNALNRLTGDKFTVLLGSGSGIRVTKMTKAGLIDLYNMVKDPENVRELDRAAVKSVEEQGQKEAGARWGSGEEAKAQIKALAEQHLTANERAFADWMYSDANDPDVRNQLNGVSRMTHGVDKFNNPQWWGRSRDRLTSQTPPSLDELTDLGAGGIKNPSIENPGWSKARVSNTTDLFFTNAIERYLSHVEESSRYIHMTGPISDAITTLRSNYGEIVNRVGVSGLQDMLHTYYRMAGLERLPQQGGEWARRNFAVATLWYRWSAIIKSRIGATVTTPFWLAGNVNAATAARFVTNPRLLAPGKSVWLFNDMRTGREILTSQSGFMASRYLDNTTSVYASRYGAGEKPTTNALTTEWRALQQFGMSPLAESDLKVATMAFLAMRKSGVPEAEAIRLTEECIKALQPPSSPADQTRIYRATRDNWALWVMNPFAGPTSAMANWLRGDYLKLKYAKPGTRGAATKRVLLTSAALALNAAACAAVTEALRRARKGWPEEDDEEKKQKQQWTLMARTGGDFLNSALPGLGIPLDLTEAALNRGYVSSPNALSSILEGVVNNGNTLRKRIQEDEWDLSDPKQQAALMRFIEAASQSTGAPGPGFAIDTAKIVSGALGRPIGVEQPITITSTK